MRAHVLAATPFALLALQQLHWGILAWDALPALTALQLVGFAGYALAAGAATGHRWRLAGAGIALCAAAEVAFVVAPTLFLPAYPLEARVLELLLVSGLCWMTLAFWRAESLARGGAWMALAYFALAAALGALDGQTLLLPGHLLGVAGLGMLLWRGAPHATRANAAQEGALP